MSAINWDRLVDRLSRTRGGRVPGDDRTLTAAASSLWVTATLAADGTATIDATLPGTDAPSASVTFPDAVLVVRDATGAELGRVGVREVTSADGADPRISAVVPWASGAAVELQSSTGAVLASRAVPATPLAVTLQSPKRNARIAAGKALPVRFTVTGAAADATIGAVVELSVDGGRTWRAVGEGSGSLAVSVPARALARSTAARVRVRVDDGLRTAVAEVRGLRLAGTPPRLRLQVPFTRGATVPKGSRGVVEAIALDDAGRTLTGGRVVWREGAKVLARGTRLSLKALKAGRHTIVVTATDRYGRTARATLALRVT
jgi:hypothetical protein